MWLLYRNVYRALSPKGGSKPCLLKPDLEPLCDLSLCTPAGKKGFLCFPTISLLHPSQWRGNTQIGSQFLSWDGRNCGGPIAGICLWLSLLLLVSHMPFFFFVLSMWWSSWEGACSFVSGCSSWTGLAQSASLSTFRGMLKSTQRFMFLQLEVPAYLLINMFSLTWLVFLS